MPVSAFLPFPELLLCLTGLAPQIYPSGIPEEQLKLLGPLSSQFSVEEISSWSVRSSDTLLALLDGRWKVPQVNPWQQRGTGAG